MIIDGYDIIEKIGEGGSATVWKAKQKSLNRLVAIKLMDRQQTEDQHQLMRFKLEAEAAARLNHPGIIQIYDTGDLDRSAYLIMEYVEGRSLDQQYGGSAAMPPDEAIEVALQVAEAMRYAWHEARMVHCDIKPGNIIIGTDGRVKLSDLGVARMLGQASDILDEDMITGTPHYSSPEQRRGEPLDARSDIYSLGATLYHLVTGIMPHDGKTHEQILANPESLKLTDPTEVNNNVPDTLAWLLEKMMVADRTDRTPDWDEVIRDLKAVQKGQMPSGLPASAAGMSTIERSPDRVAHETQPRNIRVVKKSGMKTSGKPSGPDSGAPMNTTPNANPTRAAVARFFVLILLAGSAYALVGYFKSAPKPMPSPPPESDLPATIYKASQGRSPSPQPSTSPESRFTDPPESSSSSINNPRFVRATRFLQDAQDEYNRFNRDQDQDRLARIEQQARSGLDILETLERTAQGRQASIIKEEIRKGYKIIFDVRQSKKLDLAEFVNTPPPSRPDMPNSGGAISQLFENNTPAPHQNNQPDMLDIPDDEDIEAYTPSPLTLSDDWNPELDLSSPASKDLVRLLQAYGVPEVDFSPNPAIQFPYRIGYLMPLESAIKALGIQPVERRPVRNPAFPQKSFVEFIFRDVFAGGFTEMSLLVDRKGQVVAMTFGHEHGPDPIPRLPRNLFSPSWKTVDLISGDTSTLSGIRIAHRVRPQANGVVIDTEKIFPRAFELTYQSRIFLPRPVVNLLLARNLPSDDE